MIRDRLVNVGKQRFVIITTYNKKLFSSRQHKEIKPLLCWCVTLWWTISCGLWLSADLRCLVSDVPDQLV